MTADEYRARAEECEKAANEFPKVGRKALYKYLARQWRTLAEQAERDRTPNLANTPAIE
jgi:hypothetical protein